MPISIVSTMLYSPESGGLLAAIIAGLMALKTSGARSREGCLSALGMSAATAQSLPARGSIAVNQSYQSTLTESLQSLTESLQKLKNQMGNRHIAGVGRGAVGANHYVRRKPVPFFGYRRLRIADRSSTSGSSIKMADNHDTVWVAIVGAVGLIGAALSPSIYKARLERQAAKDERDFNDGLERRINMVRRLRDFAAHGAQRAIMFHAQNAGGWPDTATEYHTSAIHFWIDGGHDGGLIENYKHIAVDVAYQEMLLEANKSPQRMVHLITSKMPVCQLRRYYEAEGVVEACVFILGLYNRRLYYLSASRYEGKFSATDITKMGLEANGIWQDMMGEK